MTKATPQDARDRRIEELDTLLYDIALMADGHKTSTLYNDGENVALANIRNMACLAIGMETVMRENGTLFAPVSPSAQTKKPCE